MRGRAPGRGNGQERNPELALLAAILLQALRDARAGDLYAAHWLTHAGAILADEYFDIAPEAVARWAELTRRRVFVKRAAKGRQPRKTWKERKAAAQARAAVAGESSPSLCGA